MTEDSLKRELEQRVEELGYEFVELDRAGSKVRPILRVRIDVPGSEPGQGVTVEDCARVSRALEPFLDGHAGVADRYVLEVSSPGIERPLTRRADWERFSGRPVVIRGRRDLLAGSRRLEGVLRGLSGQGDGERIQLELTDGNRVEIAPEDVERAHLVFRWDERK